jgi:hypothetical protein
MSDGSPDTVVATAGHILVRIAKSHAGTGGIRGQRRKGVRVATGFCTPFSTVVLRVTTVQSGSNLLRIIHP